MSAEDKDGKASISVMQQVALSLVPALIIGMGSSYLTAQVTLAKFETEQANQSARLSKVESDNANMRASLNDAVSELRVLNERIKQIDTVSSSQQRLESKVDALLFNNNTNTSPRR